MNITLPPCQDRTDTFSLQYLPECFKGQVTLKDIPSRARTPLYPVLHQHRDKNSTVKELILPMWYFSLFYLSLSEVKECILQHRYMLTQVYKDQSLFIFKSSILQHLFFHTLTAKVICLNLVFLVCS